MTDRCAHCFSILQPAPLGGRYACTNRAHRGAKPRYWSEAIPEPPHTTDARKVSRHGRPTLHFYGA